MRNKPDSGCMPLRRSIRISLLAGLAAAALFAAAFFLTGLSAERSVLSHGLVFTGGAGSAVLCFLVLRLCSWFYRKRMEELETEEADRTAHPEKFHSGQSPVS